MQISNDTFEDIVHKDCQLLRKKFSGDNLRFSIDIWNYFYIYNLSVLKAVYTFKYINFKDDLFKIYDTKVLADFNSNLSKSYNYDNLKASILKYNTFSPFYGYLKNDIPTIMGGNHRALLLHELLNKKDNNLPIHYLCIFDNQPKLSTFNYMYIVPNLLYVEALKDSGLFYKPLNKDFGGVQITTPRELELCNLCLGRQLVWFLNKQIIALDILSKHVDRSNLFR